MKKWKRLINDCAYNANQVLFDIKNDDLKEFDAALEEFINQELVEEKDYCHIYPKQSIEDLERIGENLIVNIKFKNRGPYLNIGFDPIGHLMSPLRPVMKLLSEAEDEYRKKWNGFLMKITIERNNSWYFLVNEIRLTSDEKVPIEILPILINVDKYLTNVGKCFKSQVLERFFELVDNKCKEDGVSVLDRYNLFGEEQNKNSKYMISRPTRLQNRKLLAKDLREAENEVRHQLGYPGVGEAWIGECILYKEIVMAFPEYEVEFHSHPSFLGKQHYDIFLPELRVALEYQGIQHYKPINYFGGYDGFISTQERDLRKKQISIENKISIIYVKPNYRIEEILEKVIKLSNIDSCKQNRIEFINSNTVYEYRKELQERISKYVRNESLKAKMDEIEKKQKEKSRVIWTEYTNYNIGIHSDEDVDDETLIKQICHFKEIGLSEDDCLKIIQSIRKRICAHNSYYYGEKRTLSPDYFYYKAIQFLKKTHRYEMLIDLCKEAVFLGLPEDKNLEKQTHIYSIYHCHNYQKIIEEISKKMTVITKTA